MLFRSAKIAWLLLSRQIPGLQTGATFVAVLKVAAAAAVAGLVTFFLLTPSLFGAGPLGDLASVLATWLVGGVLFVGLAHLLRVDEVGRAIRLVRSRLGK